jgi:hypothetical protein
MSFDLAISHRCEFFGVALDSTPEEKHSQS